jgi:kynureninase
MKALIAAGVVGDFRAPDTVRFGIAPLYLRYTDIWDAIEILSEIMATGTWQNETAIPADSLDSGSGRRATRVT